MPVSPEHLGIGQYQHDLSQKKLAAALDQVVEECVSFIGVDVNSSGVHLLAKVAGLNLSRAKAIVKHRTDVGKISSRDEIRKIKGIGPKSFQQAAGFLRIFGGMERLDATWIHPESYPVAKSILRQLKLSSKDIGSEKFRKISETKMQEILEDFESEQNVTRERNGSTKTKWSSRTK